MSGRCEVCQGSGQVRLPLYPSLTVAALREDVPVAVDGGYRIFACPACAPTAPVERVKFVTHNVAVREQAEIVKHPGYLDSVYRTIGAMIGAALIEAKLIRVERRKVEDYARGPVIEFRGSVAVISEHDRIKIEDRVAEHQTALVEEVMAEAVRGIDNWGSFYGHRALSKDQAKREISDALKVVLNRRGKQKVKE